MFVKSDADHAFQKPQYRRGDLLFVALVLHGRNVPHLTVGLTPRPSGINKENYCAISIQNMGAFGINSPEEFMKVVLSDDKAIGLLNIGSDGLDNRCEIKQVNLAGPTLVRAQ